MLAVADYSITQTIAVDFQSAGVPPSVLAKQYDHELRTIAVHLWDGGNAYHVPDGYVGRIAVLKPDGHHVLNDCEVHNDASYGTAVAYAVITEQLSAAAGKARAEIQISGTDGSLRTADFFLDIVPAVVGDDVITSTDEYKSIDAILAQVQESAQAAAASAAEAQDIVDEAKLEGAFDVDVQVGTVTTLDAGSNATVTNVSTQPGVAVLDFGIPRGSDAEKGMTTEEASAYAAHAHTGEDGTVRVNAMDADTVDGMHGTEFLTRTGQIITSTMHADLNDYTEPGDYYCEANVTAATITNCPHPWAFYLEVRRIGNMVIQRWTSYDVGMVSMRYKSGDSWGNWRDDPLPYSGTWTPTFYVGETAQPTTNASGKWWRLGPLVWVSFGATMANAPTVSSGELSIRGLPIAAVGQAGLACGNYNVPALDQEIVLLAVDGSKIRPLTYNVTGSYAGNSSALYGGKLAEGVTIRYASGCYLTE